MTIYQQLTNGFVVSGSPTARLEPVNEHFNRWQLLRIGGSHRDESRLDFGLCLDLAGAVSPFDATKSDSS
jgi:hypothetical protein